MSTGHAGLASADVSASRLACVVGPSMSPSLQYASDHKQTMAALVEIRAPFLLSVKTKAAIS